MSFKFYLKRRAGGGFSVKMRSYALEDRIKAGREAYPTVEKTLPENEWARYGFTSKMTYEQASEHLKTHNAKANLRDIEEKKARFELVKREEKDDLFECAYLPEAMVNDFEKKLRNDSYNFDDSKMVYHWRTAMRVIAAVELDPVEWSDSKRTVLRKLEGYAPSSIQKIIMLMNKYGVFYCKRMNQFYEPLTMPKGSEVGRMSDKYMDKTGGKTKESKGINLQQLKYLQNHDELSAEEASWCTVALGFALRPGEVDMIANRDREHLTISKGSVIIYQPKLTSLPKKMRYKKVKITHDFQKDALAIIKSTKQLKKPTIAKIKKLLGEEYGLYTFRKGYQDIMMSLGETLERTSLDMGHASIERTWRNYTAKIRND